MLDAIVELLGKDADDLLSYRSAAIPREQLHLPGPDFIDRVTSRTDRPVPVLRNLHALFNAGRLAGTGYLSILPVDQDVEHSGGASFAPEPAFFDPENIVRLALEGGCNAVASTLGALGAVARRYAHRIPFILKINHNELLSYPPLHDQTLFAAVRQGFDMGAVGIGATVYFGSLESRRQITEISEAFRLAHSLGLFTVLWCYVRNPEFKKEGANYEVSADLTGQANRLGVTIEADIIKQKQPVNNGGFTALGFGKTSPLVYEKLTSPHPIDLTRYQVMNCYMGRISLINSGGESGADDLRLAVRTAVINKRAGGAGMIVGRKAFQKKMSDGIKLLNLVQDVYLAKEIAPA